MWGNQNPYNLSWLELLIKNRGLWNLDGGGNLPKMISSPTWISDSGKQQKIGVDSGMDFFDDLETWIENIHCIHAGTCCSSNVDDWRVLSAQFMWRIWRCCDFFCDLGTIIKYDTHIHDSALSDNTKNLHAHFASLQAIQVQVPGVFKHIQFCISTNPRRRESVGRRAMSECISQALWDVDEACLTDFATGWLCRLYSTFLNNSPFANRTKSSRKDSRAKGRPTQYLGLRDHPIVKPSKCLICNHVSIARLPTILDRCDWMVQPLHVPWELDWCWDSVCDRAD